MQPQFGIPILLLATGALIWWWRDKKKHKNKIVVKHADNELSFDPVEARVADTITNKIYNSTISSDNVKQILLDFGTLGRRWLREGKYLYGFKKYFKRDDKGAYLKNEKGAYIVAYKLIDEPDSIKNSPKSLHNDVQQYEVAAIYDEMLKDEDEPFLQKYGKVLWWIAVMAFIAFLYYSK
jgi:hypothetical protein